jgi:hypothetical protein
VVFVRGAGHPFARLLEPQAVRTQVIRRGEGTKVVAELAHYQATLLATCPPGARRDIYFLMLNPALIVFLSRIHRVQLSILL